LLRHSKNDVAARNGMKQLRSFRTERIDTVLRAIERMKRRAGKFHVPDRLGSAKVSPLRRDSRKLSMVDPKKLTISPTRVNPFRPAAGLAKSAK